IFNMTAAPSGATTDVLHSGDARLDYEISPLERLSMEESFSMGQQSFSPIVAPQPGAPVKPLDPTLAQIVEIAYLSSQSTLGYQRALSPRVKLETHAGYTVSGGADAIARTVLPLMHSVQFGSSLNWATSPRDHLSFGLEANAARFSNAQDEAQPDGSVTRIPVPQEDLLLSGTVSWHTQVAHYTSVEMSLGGGAGASRQPLGIDWIPTVIAGAGLTQDIPVEKQQLTGSVRASVSSTIDRTGSGIYQVLDVSALLAYVPVKEIRLSGSAGIGRSLSGDTQQGATVVRSDLNMALSPAREVTLMMGVRMLWQRPPDAAFDPSSGLPPGALQTGYQWAGYASLMFADHWLP
ncbi:MAG TPA: hypothetical protein VMK66_18285, partial [Myxococcales bacterium]|nr:hypothetical protein [Myxococcales bacterium]